MANVDIIVRMIDQTGAAKNKTVANLKSMASSLAAVSAAAVAVGAAMRHMANEAMESQVVQAKLNAVLKSTGSAAGLTSGALSDMAMEMSKVSGVHFDLIKNAEAMMLTFTQVGSEVFPDAMRAAMDMAAVLGTDLKQPVIQIGKALNVTAGDIAAATRGMSAMSESGINFTTAQREMGIEMVRTGDIMGFQKLILDELKVEFGGAAEAMGNTAKGSAEKLKVAFSNLSGELGTNMLPAITKSNNAMAELLNTMAETVKAERALRELGQTATGYERAMGNAERTTGNATSRLESFNTGLKISRILMGDQIAAAASYDLAMQNLSSSISAVGKATQETSMSNENMMGLIMQVQSELDSYNEQNEEQVEILKALQAEQAGYVEGSKRYNEVQEKIDETKGKISELADAHEDASKRIAFSLLQQKLAVDGLDDSEFNFLVNTAERWGIIDKETAEATKQMEHNMGIYAESFNPAIQAQQTINEQIQRTKDLAAEGPIDLFVNIHTSGAFPNLPNQNQGINQGYGSGYSENATGTGGQWMTVPPGYPNDSYPVFMTSGEKYNVVTAADASSGSSSMTGGDPSLAVLNRIAEGVAALPQDIQRAVQFAVQTS